MVDRNRERLLTLDQARRLFPGRDGNPVCYRTVWRWVRTGLRGVRLETIRMGQRHVTSEQAIDRFIARYTAVCEPDAEIRPRHRQEDLTTEQRLALMHGI